MGKAWENGDLYGTSPCLMGKSTINGRFHPFSIATNYQRQNGKLGDGR